MLPRPPGQAPRATELAKEYQDLKDESDKTTANIDILQERVADLQQLLTDKQAELDESRTGWEEQKKVLMGTIAKMVGMVEESRQIADDAKMDDEERYRKEKLESEVALLQSQIVQVQMALRREQKASEAVRNRLQDVEDALEFEQMEFDKERKKLQQQLQEEKSRLEAVQKAWDNDQQSFLSNRSIIEEQLRLENQRLTDAQIAWAKNQMEYEAQTQELTAMLNEQRTRLEETQATLQDERLAFSQEKASLQAMLEADQAALQTIENQLAEEQELFRESQLKLEDQIILEQDKVQALYDRLETEQEKFEVQRQNLESSLDVERRRVLTVESELESERKAFQLERERLKREIQQQAVSSRQSKEQMAKRYNEIRSQMTALWEGAKRDARNERKVLVERYESKLASMSLAVQTLEQNLATARQASEELAFVLRDLESTQELTQKESKQTEERYISIIVQRNREIDELKSNISLLKSTVQAKEAQLESYETSFRSLWKLGLKITGNKLKNSKKRVGKWLGKDDEK